MSTNTIINNIVIIISGFWEGRGIDTTETKHVHITGIIVQSNFSKLTFIHAKKIKTTQWYNSQYQHISKENTRSEITLTRTDVSK